MDYGVLDIHIAKVQHNEAGIRGAGVYISNGALKLGEGARV